MISHERKFIFIHIPKCAGTSVEQVLFPFASPSKGAPWPVKTRNWRNKELFRALADHESYFAFTFSRNPLDRFVSLWSFFNFMSEGVSLTQFAKMVKSFLDQEPESLYRDAPSNMTRLTYDQPNGLKAIEHIDYPFGDVGVIGYHLLPQCYFLEQRVDFVGAFETLQHDFDFVCRKLGIPEQALPHEKESKREHYRSYYDSESLTLVKSMYRQDFQRLGYDV